METQEQIIFITRLAYQICKYLNGIRLNLSDRFSISAESCCQPM